MIEEPWPIFGLTVRTGGIELRLPVEAEIAALPRLAGRGVHPASDRPFLTPWAEGEPVSRERSVLRQHWGELAAWGADDWRWGAGVFVDGEPVGLVTLRAKASGPGLARVCSAWTSTTSEHRRP